MIGQSGNRIRDLLGACLGVIPIRARRLLLDTGEVSASVPMLRGTWGAALHDLSPAAYQAVFEGSGAAHDRIPLYIMRPSPPDPATAPAIEFLVIGEAHAFDAALMDAWHEAARRGLGRERKAFSIREIVELHPDSCNCVTGGAWCLSEVVGPPERDRIACEVVAPAPLRLLRQGALIERPALPDITAAGLRRITGFLGPAAAAELARHRKDIMAIARAITSSPWTGERLDLVRYSARQEAEIEMRGVCGRLALPEGPGPLAPLIAALEWLHVGKGTVMGLGQIQSERVGSG
jgi:hypothetical protein